MAPVTWFRRKPGRTQQQAQNEAQRLQRLAEEKEKYVIVEAPGDVTVRATSDVSLSGTGTSFDQTYHVETVEHRFSVGEGYMMTITAKNSGQGDTGYSTGAGDTLTPPGGVPSTSPAPTTTPPPVGTPTQLPGNQGFSVVI